MLIFSEIHVSRARLRRILDGCGQINWRVVTFYEPIGLIHDRSDYFLDVVGRDGAICGSVASGPEWDGAMVWTNLHVLRRALRRRHDAFVSLQFGCARFLVDGMDIEWSDPLKGLDMPRPYVAQSTSASVPMDGSRMIGRDVAPEHHGMFRS
jgi:hypothetical protein